MDLKSIDCEAGTWMVLILDHIQWQALILVMMNLLGLRGKSWLSVLCRQNLKYARGLVILVSTVDASEDK